MEAITVVTATINRPGLLAACESVQAQTLAPVKHIILLQQLMESPVPHIPKPSRVPLEIHWLPPPQPHIVEALSYVESLARTPWVAMLDDDCWWEKDHLEVLGNLMDETSADFVWSSSMIHGEDGREGVWMGLDGVVHSYKDEDRPIFGCIDTNEILFRRENIEKWGGFRMEEHRGIDGRRIERWVKNGAVYAHSSVPTNHYTWRPVPAFA